MLGETRRKRINDILKKISGNKANIGAIKYTTAAYKRIESYSENTKAKIQQLEERKAKIEEEKNKPPQRTPPAKTARISQIKEDEIQFAKETKPRVQMSKVGGGGIKKKSSCSSQS